MNIWFFFFNFLSNLKVFWHFKYYFVYLHFYLFVPLIFISIHSNKTILFRNLFGGPLAVPLQSTRGRSPQVGNRCLRRCWFCAFLQSCTATSLSPVIVQQIITYLKEIFLFLQLNLLWKRLFWKMTVDTQKFKMTSTFQVYFFVSWVFATVSTGRSYM